MYRPSPGLVPDVVRGHVPGPVHPVKLVFGVPEVLKQIYDGAVGDVAVEISPFPCRVPL